MRKLLAGLLALGLTVAVVLPFSASTDYLLWLSGPTEGAKAVFGSMSAVVYVVAIFCGTLYLYRGFRGAERPLKNLLIGAATLVIFVGQSILAMQLGRNLYYVSSGGQWENDRAVSFPFFSERWGSIQMAPRQVRVKFDDWVVDSTGAREISLAAVAWVDPQKLPQSFGMVRYGVAHLRDQLRGYAIRSVRNHYEGQPYPKPLEWASQIDITNDPPRRPELRTAF